MLNGAVLKQEYQIHRKTLLIFLAMQMLCILLAGLIRNMRLIEIADVFFDTLPTVVLPMILQMMLAYETVIRREQDKTMAFTLAAGISPARIITAKLMFMVINVFLLLVISTFFGCVGKVYDLTGVWDRDHYIGMNIGAMCMQLFIGGYCFAAACLKNERADRFYRAVGIGVPAVFFVIHLGYYYFPQLVFLRYMTVFSLFEPQMFAEGSLFAFVASVVLAAAGIALFLLGKHSFCKRYQHF